MGRKGLFIIVEMLAVSLALMVLPIGAQSAQPGLAESYGEQAELFARALAQVGLTPDDVQMDARDMALWGGDKYRLKLLDVFFDDPWKISPYTRSLTDGLLQSDEDLTAIVVSAHKRLDRAVRLGLIGDPLEAQKLRVQELGGKNLAVALAELTGRPDAEFKTVEYRALPDAVRDAAALVLFTVPEVMRYRELALEAPLKRLGLDPEATYREVLDYVITTWEEDVSEEAEDLEQVLLMEALMDNCDWTLLNTGATLLAIAAQEAKRMLAEADAEALAQDFDFIANTPMGYVMLGGIGGGYYGADDHLLIIDTGGDDAYASGAANRSFACGASVCLDLAGNDTYKNEGAKTPAFGAGVFGYGILIDCAGDDTYETPYVGEGCGVFGTGVLWDCAGNDRYDGMKNLQGCGVFGTGILIDNAGDDVYALYEYGQGYGYTMGCGYLIDTEGDDKYIGKMEPQELSNGGPFGAERFIHFAQGAAFGRRSDFTDGHSWAGGVGILTDGAGDDEYTCDVYGQGTGYWYSVGILADKTGDDKHQGGSYSLGSAPHFAVGVLQDESGDDRYYMRQIQCLGNGRDWSIGWFEDAAGDDWYQGGAFSFGTGDVNGLGLFWDRAGDDTYIAKGISFGQSRMESGAGLRDFMLTLGLFVDGGGLDRYLRLPGDEAPSGTPTPELMDAEGLAPLELPYNGACWSRETQGSDVPGACGAGIDAE
jgi:hypothetical protein